MNPDIAYLDKSIRCPETLDDSLSRVPSSNDGNTYTGHAPNGPSDETLLRSVSRGEQTALGELFKRHALIVKQIGNKILRQPQEADDVLQDVFLYIFKRAATYDSTRGTVRNWIIQISYGRALDRRRYLLSRGFYDHTSHEDNVSRILPQKQIEETTIDELTLRQIRQRFWTDLAVMQRITLELHFFEGLTLQEISEKTGHSLSNVRSYYYRGLNRLRSLVAKEK